MALKVLVGMMHSDESTVEEAVSAVQTQRGCDVTVVRITGLSEAEAHKALYERFNEVAHRFDMMVKVDPDMLVRSEVLFGSVQDLFRRWPGIGSVVVPVWDYLTGQNILGMHFWRRGVNFSTPESSLWADHVTISTRPDLRVVVSVKGQAPTIHFSKGTDTQLVRYVWRRLIKNLASNGGLQALTPIPRQYVDNGDAFRSRAVDALARGLRADMRERVFNAVIRGSPEGALEGALNPSFPVSQAEEISRLLSGRKGKDTRRELNATYRGQPGAQQIESIRLPRSYRRALRTMVLNPAASIAFHDSMLRLSAKNSPACL